MALRIELHPGAEIDIEEARRWYAQRSPIAAHAFLLEVEHVMERVAGSPERWPSHIADTRSYSFPRFPFRLVYFVRDSVVVVVAVCHHRRKPGYWAVRGGK
ncbi:MAG: type II toxin-antitoxin system RelE/ParE family toxin [Xanthomonadales bacterium PRO7]|nr:type II toxin-antitoxin system RelE/ParE family toxin [Xanthomonadales bacterium PRO7]